MYAGSPPYACPSSGRFARLLSAAIVLALLLAAPLMHASELHGSPDSGVASLQDGGSPHHSGDHESASGADCAETSCSACVSLTRGNIGVSTSRLASYPRPRSAREPALSLDPRFRPPIVSI